MNTVSSDERMKLLVICLLVVFLHVVSCSSASSDFAVIQRTDVTVSEGDTVELSCCWTVEYEKITVHWFKNKTIVQSKRFKINDMNKDLMKKKSDCWNLTLTAVTEQDAGTYICKVTVDIPLYVTAEGSGTVITVMVKDNTTHSVPEDDSDTIGESKSEGVLVQALRCLPILALLLSLFCLNQWVTKARQTASASSEKDRPSGQRQEEDGEEEEEGKEEREGEAE
ncbi:uncharacterized protein V6R79_005270 [Siganus canaliculatus]